MNNPISIALTQREGYRFEVARRSPFEFGCWTGTAQRSVMGTPGAGVTIGRAMVRMAWRGIALALLALGMVGVVVPGLPTVPFLLAAAWAAGRGWPALEQWLLNHPRYGPGIVRWRERGAVARSAKWAASLMMLLSAAVLVASSAPVFARLAVPILMGAVALWLWKRPEE